MPQKYRDLNLAARFFIVFAVAFGVNALIVHSWNVVFESAGGFDWGKSLTLSLVIACVLTVIEGWRGRKRR